MPLLCVIPNCDDWSNSKNRVGRWRAQFRLGSGSPGHKFNKFRLSGFAWLHPIKGAIYTRCWQHINSLHYRWYATPKGNCIFLHSKFTRSRINKFVSRKTKCQNLRQWDVWIHTTIIGITSACSRTKWSLQEIELSAVGTLPPLILISRRSRSID